MLHRKHLQKDRPKLKIKARKKNRILKMVLPDLLGIHISQGVCFSKIISKNTSCYPAASIVEYSIECYWVFDRRLFKYSSMFAKQIPFSRVPCTNCLQKPF